MNLPWRTALCTLAMAMATSVPMLAAATAPRPDVLLIMPDQFRGDCLSVVGHPVVRTPNLDALAVDGALFRRAYSTAPSCIPARHALLTGQAPQTSGIVGYALRPLRVRPLPELLAQSGYATVLVGRNMHQAPESGSLGYRRQLLGSTYVAGDDYDRALISAAPASAGIRKIVGGRKKGQALLFAANPRGCLYRAGTVIARKRRPLNSCRFVSTASRRCYSNPGVRANFALALLRPKRCGAGKGAPHKISSWCPIRRQWG